jgi:TRAP-type C4-dicarboxylate transport system permease small subunit
VGKFERIVNKIGNWGTAVGCIFMLGIAAVIVATVIGRALHIALPGTFDLVETLVVVAIAFALVFGQLQDRHLRADLAIERMKGRVKAGVESVLGILNLGYWAVLLYAGSVMMMDKWEGGEATDLLNVPVVPFRAVFVFALILMVLLLFIKEIREIKKLIKGGDEK